MSFPRRFRRAFGASVILCVVFFTASAAAFAQNYAPAPIINLEVSIGETRQVAGLATYVALLFRFFVPAIAIIAASLITYAGVRWLVAAGNPQVISEAQERIRSALAGLVLALISYVLLSTVNPVLTHLANPGISIITLPEPTFAADSSTAGAASCNESEWVDIASTMTSSTAASIYQGNTDASVSKAMPEAIAKLQNAILAADAINMTIFVNGASRSMATQQRLWDCYQNSKSNPNWNNGAVCAAPCTGCNIAAKPQCSSPHMTGKAFDTAWYPKSGGAYVSLRGKAKGACNAGACGSTSTERTNLNNSMTALQTLMQGQGFSRYCSEWWHFESTPLSRACSPGQY